MKRSRHLTGERRRIGRYYSRNWPTDRPPKWYIDVDGFAVHVFDSQPTVVDMMRIDPVLSYVRSALVPEPRTLVYYEQRGYAGMHDVELRYAPLPGR